MLSDLDQIKKNIARLKLSNLNDYKNLNGLFEMCLSRYEVSKDIKKSLQLCKLIKSKAAELSTTDTRFFELYNKCLLFEAPHLFDSYLLYLEKDREYKDRFYLPKRRQLIHHGLIQTLQDLEDDKLDIGSISMPPGTQKTTLEKFFASWVIGRHPDDYSLFYSHSGDITRMFYDGILSITTDSIEYKWGDIFPGIKLQDTNAKTETINFGKYKPFANIQCSSVGAKNAGKVRCNRYLYCDDLIGGIEEALNKNRLDKLWSIYSVDGKQRKMDGCKELHIATRWSVHDIIGRIQNLYEGSNRVRFISIPDIDPVTGKSNFDYEYNGFSVEFFNDQALSMDDISYRCLYKNEPIEREGLLYTDEELRRYLELPLHEPDAIIGICDTKNEGSDYMFLPAIYQYGEDFYCPDCVCDDNPNFGIQEENCANIIVNHKMQQCQFESNNGGSRVAYNVNALVEKKHGRCNITSKTTTSNKETKIIVNADWVKKHVLFKDKSMYTSKSQYGKMMGFLLGYSVKGKNLTDDVPDGFAQLALYVTNSPTAKVTVFDRSKLGI
jgi:hypothetical protein